MKKLRTFIISVAIVFLVVVLAFVPLWYSHTGNVQDMVRSDLAVYQNENVEWSSVSVEDPKYILENAIKSLRDLKYVLGGYEGSYDFAARHAYRESLYELLGIINFNPSDEKLSAAIEKVAEKYEIWMVSVEKFLGNRILAMPYTF